MCIFLRVTCLIFIINVVRSQQPNVIVIVADDMGWNDVGFHGSNQIPTPNIDALAYSGIILNNYYTMHLCTPSRAALLTGRHPIHTGMQHYVIVADEPWGLGLEEKLLPEYLRDVGYSTHALGKWHLGFCNQEFTPTFRGFNSHFGYWTSHQDYLDHTLQLESGDGWGYDMRSNTNITRSGLGDYTTRILTDEAVRIINEHDSERGPLFLYLAHLAVHVGNLYRPLQAPQETVDLFQHIQDPARRIFAAMMTELDYSVGAVVEVLQSRGLLENSVIVFTTDNGGSPAGAEDSMASNWPLRGAKNSAWEGALHGAALVWSPLLGDTPPRVSKQLMHIQDWLPTLVHVAGGTTSEDPPLDGVNVWAALSDPDLQPRDNLLLMIDDISGYYAIKMNQWKLMSGANKNTSADMVFPPSGREGSYNISAVLDSQVAHALASTTRPLPSEETIRELRGDATLECSELQEGAISTCNPRVGKMCLFDIVKDPCESYDLASEYPDVVSEMLRLLEAYNATAVPTRNQPGDPASDPKLWGGVWTNWKDLSQSPSTMLQK